MKALSVRQPWAWLIIAGHKPIENRTWSTAHRGPLLIHAALRWHATPLAEIEQRFGIRIPTETMQFGGIIGVVELDNVVTQSVSRWFDGPYGFVLSKPRAVPFMPLRGEQGLFDAPDL